MIDGSCSTTVSVGIAYLKINEQPIFWLERADHAAKESKMKGKNIVTISKG